MKKLLSVFVLLVISFAVMANPVDVNTARAIGYGFLRTNTDLQIKGNVEQIDAAKIYRTESGVPCFYLFNMGQGYVIVSADDCASPILGYSDESIAYPDNLPDAMQEYLDAFIEQIQYGIEHHLAASEEIARQWDLVKTTGRITENRNAKAVTPLLPDQWNQDCYYNNLCPVDAAGSCGHTYVGCTGLAMGQIMHYWGYPIHGSGSTSYTPSGYPTQSVNFGATTYDWANMPNSLTSSSSATQIAATATMLWHCGVALHASYGSDGTGAYPTDVPNVLTTYFTYASDLSGQWKSNNTTWLNQCKASLDLSRPIHYSGWTNSGSGHSFVCDGYDDSDLLHFNWGWGGYSNGYFAVGALNVAGYQFNASNYAVFNIHPNTSTSYTVTATANPTNGGTITGAGTYNQGETCTLVATPNSGYTFTNWTENGTQVSTNATYSFTVTANRTLVANFALSTYTITATANPTNGGTITGAGTYNQGQTCTLVATPNSGYTFTNWTENGTQVSTNATYSFTVTANRTLVANFALSTYTITATANPTNGGTITGAGTYNQGQTCTLVATPSANYTFTNWMENGTQVSTSATYSFTVTANRTLVANFTRPTYTITATANPTNGGTITGAGTYNQGETCTLVATPSANHTFTNWTENGTQVSTNATYSFTVTANRNLVAHFSQNTYTITATASPTNGGTITGAGTYNYGQTCTLVATSNETYDFENWTLNGNVVSTDPSYSFTVTNNSSFVAHFAVKTFTVSVSADGEGTVSGGGTFSYGQTCAVTAHANTNYHFLYWTENATPVSYDLEYIFDVTSNRVLVAHFTIDTYDIMVTANPQEGGTVSGGGTFAVGEVVVVNVEPNSGYVFQGWYENGEVVSMEEAYSFTVEGNRNLVASLYYYEGVADHSGSDISVYPNPAHDYVNVEGDDIAEVRIYNALGQLVFSQSNDDSHQIRVNLSSVNSSICYMVVVTTNSGMIAKRVVID